MDVDEIYLLKGIGEPLITITSSSSTLILLAYADGSTGICRDGTHFGTWEPCESEDCLHLFVRLIVKDVDSCAISLLGRALEAAERRLRRLCVLN